MKQLLTDASALIAYLVSEEDGHDQIVEFLTIQRVQCITTGPALAEAMHMLRKLQGYPGQEALWGLRTIGLMEIAKPNWDRSEALMNQYNDVPMDLADATLVALAEQLNQDIILTLDDDFFIYQIQRGHNAKPFVVVPSVKN
ncbi:MAG: type II toxin-antitoxin system VapC family toxin [Candidatus Dormibacteraceae bacterium]